MIDKGNHWFIPLNQPYFDIIALKTMGRPKIKKPCNHFIKVDQTENLNCWELILSQDTFFPPTNVPFSLYKEIVTYQLHETFKDICDTRKLTLFSRSCEGVGRHIIRLTLDDGEQAWFLFMVIGDPEFGLRIPKKLL